MNEVILLQSAQTDLLEIYSKRGEDYYGIIDSALEVLRSHPEIAPVYSGRFRRRVVRDTPFGIFYTVVGMRIVVSFIMDLRQDPASITKRLEKGS
ncbi:MAG: type II toxin-antitoxin system RelE/ParE family toxin [Verrucomicrobiales bacterium]|nr:type II toxin-antitoxin system RelE/ParE family toxin [Verrucomicrobiales bacterium]